MKESIGYTVTLNIVITFIIIIFAFLSAVLVYYKSYKVSNIITDAIEKYEGYNDNAKIEITNNLNSIGYNKKKLNRCNDINGCSKIDHNNDGYCVYLCTENVSDECYYYYKIKSNMVINIPIINDIIDFPIFSNTNRMYDFEDQHTCKIP